MWRSSQFEGEGGRKLELWRLGHSNHAWFSFYLRRGQSLLRFSLSVLGTRLVNPSFSVVYKSIGSKEISDLPIIISGPCSLHAIWPAVVIFFYTKKITSETRWEVANKVGDLVMGIFYSDPKIYLCINTGIYFVLSDSEFFMRGLLQVGDTVDMRVSGGFGVLCMCEWYWTSWCPRYGFNYLAHTSILLL